MRFKQFLKGIFLYNTIYWRRASDELNIRRMSREERASLRPKRDLEIIRPRGNPRPAATPAPDSRPTNVARAPLAPEAATPLSDVGAEDGQVEIRRRKRRRRSHHRRLFPKRDHGPSGGGGGMLGWLFKK